MSAGSPIFAQLAGADSVANHPTSLIDSVLLPTLNAATTSSLFRVLIDLVIGTEIIQL